MGIEITDEIVKLMNGDPVLFLVVFFHSVGVYLVLVGLKVILVGRCVGCHCILTVDYFKFVSYHSRSRGGLACELFANSTILFLLPHLHYQLQSKHSPKGNAQ